MPGFYVNIFLICKRITSLKIVKKLLIQNTLGPQYHQGGVISDMERVPFKCPFWNANVRLM